jgi:hypothetical protein
MAGEATTTEASEDAKPVSESWRRRIELVVQSLQARFGATVDLDLIRAEVEAGFAGYSHARVREFVPILVETRVRSRLSQPPN